MRKRVGTGSGAPAFFEPKNLNKSRNGMACRALRSQRLARRPRIAPSGHAGLLEPTAPFAVTTPRSEHYGPRKRGELPRAARGGEFRGVLGQEEPAETARRPQQAQAPLQTLCSATARTVAHTASHTLTRQASPCGGRAPSCARRCLLTPFFATGSSVLSRSWLWLRNHVLPSRNLGQSSAS